MNKDKTRERVRVFATADMVMVALFAAILCVMAPFSIPIGPVPISLATLVIYFSLYFLNWKQGMVMCVVYLLLGLAGLPVFSGFSGGVGKLVGPTGGYLVGYLVLVLIAGSLVEKFRKNKFLCIAGMVIGTAIFYGFGTAWFCISTGTGVLPALAICVFPFLIGDTVKILIAAFVAPSIADSIRKNKE